MVLDQSTGDSLFGNFKKKSSTQKLGTSDPTQSLSVSGSSSKGLSTQPKYSQLDKVTVLLTSEQKEGLDRMAKKIMKFRSNQLRGVEEKERITANTILRSLIDNFLELEDSLQLETLTSEKEVREWISRVFK